MFPGLKLLSFDVLRSLLAQYRYFQILCWSVLMFLGSMLVCIGVCRLCATLPLGVRRLHDQGNSSDKCSRVYYGLESTTEHPSWLQQFVIGLWPGYGASCPVTPAGQRERA